MLDFLPLKISRQLNKIGYENLNEIRLRVGQVVTVCVNGENKLLSDGKNLITITSEELESCVLKITDGSIYSFDEQIKRGFITYKNGVRIGLAGEFVYEKGQVVTIKNFSSLNVRIPHFILNCSAKFYDEYYKNGNLLIISKVGVGKTTFLRDMCVNLSAISTKNIVVLDERNEIAAKYEDLSFNLGTNVDVMTYCDKTYGFNNAVRALNPDYILCDELMSKEDVIGVYNAINCGVKVIATLHASSIDDLKRKEQFKSLIEYKLFDQVLLLEKSGENRTFKVYDENLIAYDC